MAPWPSPNINPIQAQSGEDADAKPKPSPTYLISLVLLSVFSPSGTVIAMLRLWPDGARVTDI
jgi:hypothetical protein